MKITIEIPGPFFGVAIIDDDLFRGMGPGAVRGLVERQAGELYEKALEDFSDRLNGKTVTTGPTRTE